jgi:prefoldin alpha subunit
MAKRTIKIENGSNKRDDNKKKASAQERYIELQMIDQQVKQLQKYLQAFDQQLVEIRSVVGAVQEFSKLKKGSMIFAPISNGIFIKAKLEDNESLRVNVGNNVVVTKTADEAIALLQSQEAEIVQYRSETVANMEQMLKKLEELQAD